MFTIHRHTNYNYAHWMVMWHCQIAGSTLETAFWHEAVAAADDDAVGNDDP